MRNGLPRGWEHEVVALAAADNFPAGARFLLDSEGGLLASRPAGPLPAAALQHVRPLSERPRPYVAGGFSFLPTLPRCRLIIVGAGHVGQKTAELAADVDFDVCVIDDRAEYCSPSRFPQAKRLIVGPISRALKDFETTPDDFAVIVTRGHQHDEEALFRLVDRPLRYLG